MVQAFQALGDTDALPKFGTPERKAIEALFSDLFTKCATLPHTKLQPNEVTFADYYEKLSKELVNAGVDKATIEKLKKVCEALVIDLMGVVKQVNQTSNDIHKEKGKQPKFLSMDEVFPLLIDLLPKVQNDPWVERDVYTRVLRTFKYISCALPVVGLNPELSYYLVSFEALLTRRLERLGKFINASKGATAIALKAAEDEHINTLETSEDDQHCLEILKRVRAQQPEFLEAQQALTKNQWHAQQLNLHGILGVNKIFLAKGKEAAKRELEAKKAAEKQEAIKKKALEKQRKATEKYKAKLEATLDEVRCEYEDLLDRYLGDLDKEARKNPELHTFLYRDGKRPKAEILEKLIAEKTPTPPKAVSQTASVAEKTEHAKAHKDYEYIKQARVYVKQHPALKTTMVKVQATRFVLGATSNTSKTERGVPCVTAEDKLVETTKRIQHCLQDKRVIACRDSQLMTSFKNTLVKIGSLVSFGLGKTLRNWLFKPESVRIANKALSQIKKLNPNGFFNKKPAQQPRVVVDEFVIMPDEQPQQKTAPVARAG